MPRILLYVSIAITSLSLLLLVLFIFPIWASMTNSPFGILSSSVQTFDKPVGVWGPFADSGQNLEQLKGINQSKAISEVFTQGFGEYYFVMSDFENPKLVESTESLLRAVENLDLNLKTIIIVLPPSEGGPDGNYNWKGWIKYFNSLKQKHSDSFEGFTIDDFNWISTRNDTRFENNIDFMVDSNLVDALKLKREDVKFLPTVYFEGQKTDVIIDKFLNYVDGIVAVSGCYYNVSALEPQLRILDILFDSKPMRYVVYPTITHNYSRQYYSPPSDGLVISTLSIASNFADGIIVWHDIGSPVIQEYLKNFDNNRTYLSRMDRVKDLQIEDELVSGATVNKIQINSTETEKNCLDWYKKYLDAYNYWLSSDLDPDQYLIENEDGSLKKTLLRFIN